MLEKNLSLKETFDLAVENHRAKHFKVAANLYNKLLIEKPNHVQTIFLLGTLFMVAIFAQNSPFFHGFYASEDDLSAYRAPKSYRSRNRALIKTVCHLGSVFPLPNCHQFSGQ